MGAMLPYPPWQGFRDRDVPLAAKLLVALRRGVLVGPPRREQGQAVEHCGLGMIEVGEAKHRVAVPVFGFLRSHAGGLPCRSTELPHICCGTGSAHRVCLGDVTTTIRGLAKGAVPAGDQPDKILPILNRKHT